MRANHLIGSKVLTLETSVPLSSCFLTLIPSILILNHIFIILSPISLELIVPTRLFLIASLVLLQNQFMANIHEICASQVIRIVLLLILVFIKSACV